MKTTLLILTTAATILAGCGTTDLKNQVTALAQNQTQLNRERDSLVRLVAIKTDTLESREAAYTDLASVKTALEGKAKSLQVSLNTRTKQLNTAVATNDKIESEVAREQAKNDSLMKEIAILHGKIAEIDSRINQEQQENVALNESLKMENQRRIADSTVFANTPKPEPVRKGFVHIGELGAGMGLGDTDPSYSARLVSIDYILGYNINNFMAGAGTGVNFYNNGTMIPLFLDFRYHFTGKSLSPYLAADGGMLFSLEKFNESGMFLNPQFGFRRRLNDKMRLNLSTGLYLQYAPAGARNTFVNLKAGFSFGK